MKYLKYFTNESDYQTFKDSEEYILPNVSYIVEGDKVEYNANIETDIIIKYQDRKKLGIVFEDVYSKLLQNGYNPVGTSIYNSVNIKFPIANLGGNYNTISIECNKDYFIGPYSNIGYFFSNTNVYKNSDQWTPSDELPENPNIDNVDVVYIELSTTRNSGLAMCRILYPDGTKEYGVYLIAG